MSSGVSSFLSPVGGGSKLEVVLEPSATAAEAIKVILRVLLDALLANESGARADSDPEFLHDFRVALRRARSALGQLREVLPAEGVARLRAELAWLGQASGPTRDLDVYLLTLREEKAALPAAVRVELAPLVAHLRGQQRREQKKLRTALDSERYRALIAAWRQLLDLAPEGAVPENAQRPVLEVAQKRLSRAFRRVIERGRAIDAASPPEALHALRIECKKLRYLLELFQSLLPRAEVEALIRRLKRLQENLGAFNDCQVQQRHLERSAHELAEKGHAPVATLLAMGRLLAWLEARQEEERLLFAASFADFAAKPNRRRFRRLLEPG